MLTVLLYGVATFMETGIGILIFSKMFPKRESMQGRHVFSEWILFTLIFLGAYTFPNYFWNMDKNSWYLPTLIGAYCFVLILNVNKLQRSKFGKINSNVDEVILFIEMSVVLSWQYWDSYQSDIAMLLGNVLPVLFLYVFYQCSFIQVYLWQFLYVTNIGMMKVIYITYIGTFTNEHFEKFTGLPRSHTYSEVIY